MSILSPVSVRKMERALKKLGFKCLRQKGSHAFYEHPDGRVVMLGIHYGEDLSRGLLHKIITDDLKMSVEEFNQFK